MSNGRESFSDIFIWSDEATFEFNGTINLCSCVYWATEDPKIIDEQIVNLPGTSVCCAMSSRAMLGPFIFAAAVTDPAYVKLLEEVISCISTFFLMKTVIFNMVMAHRITTLM